MKEINCNVIRDLLPSYVDQICSGDSRLLVEEHLNDCEQCRLHLKMMKDTELTDRQGEQRRISYLKKVKKYYISFTLLTLLMAGGVWLLAQRHEIVGSSLFYVIFPIAVIAAYCLLPDSPPSAKRTKLSGALMAMSVLLMMVYFSVIIYWIKQMDMTGSGPFGIPLNVTGYYMDKLLKLVIVIQFGIFVLSNILVFCAYRVNKCIYGLSLTGVYLAIGAVGLLHNMTTVETLYGQLSKITGYIVLEGIVFSVASYIAAKTLHPLKKLL